MLVRLRSFTSVLALATLFSLVSSCSTPPPPKPAAPPPPPPTATPVPPPPTPTPRTYNYPAAAKGSVIEDYHGTKVADPYRWMDKADDPATTAWVDAENGMTEKFLNRPERAEIKARLTQLINYPRVGVPFRYGRFYFFSKNSGLQNQSVYYVQEGLTGEPRAVIDPNTLSADGTVALSNTSPSHDGKLLGYALSKSGSDRQEIFVRNIAAGKDLIDHLLWMKFSSIAWTHDGRGFYYERLPQPGTVPAGEEHYFPKVYYHGLGDPQRKDKLIFEKPGEKEVGVGAAVSHDGRWLILFAVKGASDKTEVQVLDLKKPGAKPSMVFKGYDSAWNVAGIVNGKLYASTDKDAARRRVVVVDVAKLKSGSTTEAPSQPVVAETKDILTDCEVINHRLILSYLRNASTALAVHSLSGHHENDIALPGIGTVGAVSGKPDQKEMFLSYTSYTEPPTNFRYDFDKRQLVVFHKTDVPVDTAQYETEQVWYPSKDGTKVSMFLVHKMGLARDGKRPTLLYAYGGFNISMTPRFSATNYVFLEKGGLLAVANLRGGGEYGEEWHKAGMRDKKQNVFDDFAAAGEWLVSSGWTRPERLAIEGGSNGGLLVAAVEEQRPDLFAAVICQVPVADMLRFHKFTLGRYWIAEYGNADEKDDFPFLYKYSPLQNVKDGVNYPATLITTADTDDRVDPSHSKKFAARMQAADGGKNPVLIRIETKAGHGGGKPISKQIEENADIYTFLFWRLGVN
jgi:prolyl oligopeptidase